MTETSRPVRPFSESVSAMRPHRLLAPRRGELWMADLSGTPKILSSDEYNADPTSGQRPQSDSAAGSSPR